ncbi:efflux RND transporter periplasmic adaptor subunit [Methylobacterium durans]|uniref:efflux RND transporter periplasmic adaptor subunit n=1 Tax=Methylobacterium durans TaxID=2202825 RepID=UPI002AFF1546|nr:efflux RND transporter periplasmic adaptor subunit [Methylobacterium durans]MEA1834543.1 efflux RND transporter periplasmic adaptor subunit [Methylobacterium durans]
MRRGVLRSILLPILALAAAQAAAEGDAGVRGVVRALRDASVATDLNGRVVQLPFREGEAFKAGDTLVAFDCDKAMAELRSAKAEDQVNRIAYDNAQQLDRRQAIGRIEVQAAKAKWEKAQAAAEALQVRVRDCRILAPFAGRVAELRIHEHEMSTPGQPLMRIVDAGALEIDLIVPSAWLVWLKPGAPMSVRIDETGLGYGARVVRTAAAVDPVSQTIKITAHFAPGDIGAVLPGMSLDARFDRPAH